MSHAARAASKSAAPVASHCADCRAPLLLRYYSVDGAATCESCRVARALPLSAGVVVRAIGFGLVGALLGAALHWTVRALLDVEVGYVSLVIGFVVGAGVRLGARRRGLGLQLLAVALTYLAIALSHLPAMLSALSERGVGPLGGRHLLDVAGMVLSLPVRIGLVAPKSLVITGVALFTAWRLTKPGAGVVSGPHSLPASRGVAPAEAARPAAVQAVIVTAPSVAVRPAPVGIDPQGGSLLDRAARQIANEKPGR